MTILNNMLFYCSGNFLFAATPLDSAFKLQRRAQFDGLRAFGDDLPDSGLTAASGQYRCLCNGKINALASGITAFEKTGRATVCAYSRAAISSTWAATTAK